MQTVTVPREETPTAEVSRLLFQGKIQPGQGKNCLTVVSAQSIHAECVLAAERILELTASGCRYRDISLVCADMGSYRGELEMVLKRCHIPVYVAGTEEVLEKSVITTVLSAMDAALGGLEQQDVLRYIKSALSPLSLEECDQLEAYVRLWNISGSRWLTPWTGHPKGLTDVWTTEDEALLEGLNGWRQQITGPLDNLRKAFAKATSVAQQVQALYAFVEGIGLADRLNRLAKTLDAQGDNREAQILSQLWEILLGAMEQLYDKNTVRCRIYTKDERDKAYPGILCSYLTNEYADNNDNRALWEIWSEGRMIEKNANKDLTMLIRVHPDADHDFRETFLSTMRAQLTAGNLSIVNLTRMEDYRTYILNLSSINLMYGAGYFLAAFFFICAFLGIIGTFWFRTESRTSEIGLRMALGATRRQVRWQMIGEGLMLLGIVWLPAVIVSYVLRTAVWDNETLLSDTVLFITLTAVTTVLLMLLIVAGIWIPARQAGKPPI